MNALSTKRWFSVLRPYYPNPIPAAEELARPPAFSPRARSCRTAGIHEAAAKRSTSPIARSVSPSKSTPASEVIVPPPRRRAFQGFRATLCMHRGYLCSVSLGRRSISLHHRHDRCFLRVRLTFATLDADRPDAFSVGHRDGNGRPRHCRRAYFPRYHQPQCVPSARPSVGSPHRSRRAVAKDKPLSDRSSSHMAFSFQRNNGSLAECRGVWVITLNWNRQSPLEH